MVMFYFSGTGNSKYVAELFSQNMKIPCHSIEEGIDFAELISAGDVVGFCYPIYMSCVPRIMREFVAQHITALKGKKIIIFCTQLWHSGDGTRRFAALFPKNYIDVIYTEHFFMPNNMNDIPLLPVASEKSMKKTLAREKRRMDTVCNNIKNGKVKRRGFSFVSHLLGIPQAIFLSAVERRANRVVRIDGDCTQCGLCVDICPMKNFSIVDGEVKHNGNCTMCYRCNNKCPHKAISLLIPGKVKKQYMGIR